MRIYRTDLSQIPCNFVCFCVCGLSKTSSKLFTLLATTSLHPEAGQLCAFVIFPNRGIVSNTLHCTLIEGLLIKYAKKPASLFILNSHYFQHKYSEMFEINFFVSAMA